MIQKRTDNRPKVLTTGQVARICSVAPRTVSKWFDMGQLRGYRIPGSRDRRIPVDLLIRFMKAHNMPLNGLDAGPGRVLLVLSDMQLSQTVRQQLEQAGFQVETAQGEFQAGLQAERFHPHVVVLEAVPGPNSIASAVRHEPRRRSARRSRTTRRRAVAAWCSTRTTRGSRSEAGPPPGRMD